MNSTPPTAFPVDATGTAERLATLVRIPTVSLPGTGPGEAPAFARLRETIGRVWPTLTAALEREVTGGGLLYRWEGADPSLAPILLMAHQDVVASTGLDAAVADERSTAPGWSVPPFAGLIRDGYVWGRGTLDDKGSMAVILDAVESLLAEGFRPRRGVLIFFGCDEETDGSSARAAAAVLGERGVRPWMVLDEGGAVVEGALPGVRGRTALVGVSEKGTSEFELRTEDAGGHASTPGRRGATARLARAITRIDDHPFPVHLSEPVIELFERVAPLADGPAARAYANARRLAPVLARALAIAGPETAALVRTTTVVTELSGSPAHNVIATSARAVVNARIAVGETIESTLARLRRIVRDPTVEITAVRAGNPSPVSPSSGPQWEALGRALHDSHPDAVLLPYVQLGASDSRAFTGISAHVYRFSPFFMSSEERGTLHGIDERICIDTLGAGVRFYRRLLRDL